VIACRPITDRAWRGFENRGSSAALERLPLNIA